MTTVLAGMQTSCKIELNATLDLLPKGSDTETISMCILCSDEGQDVFQHIPMTMELELQRSNGTGEPNQHPPMRSNN